MNFGITLMRCITWSIIIMVCIMAYDSYSQDKQCEELGYDYSASDSFLGNPYCQYADSEEKPRPWIKKKSKQ